MSFALRPAGIGLREHAFYRDQFCSADISQFQKVWLIAMIVLSPGYMVSAIHKNAAMLPQEISVLRLGTWKNRRVVLYAGENRRIVKHI